MYDPEELEDQQSAEPADDGSYELESLPDEPPPPEPDTHFESNDDPPLPEPGSSLMEDNNSIPPDAIR